MHCAPAYHIGLIHALHAVGYRIVDMQQQVLGEDDGLGSCFLMSIAYCVGVALPGLLSHLCARAVALESPIALHTIEGWMDAESRASRHRRIKWLPQILQRNICIVSAEDTRFYGSGNADDELLDSTIVLALHPKDAFGTRHVDPCVPIRLDEGRR